MLFKHDHSNTQFMIHGGLLGFSICLPNILNDRLPNHLSKDVAFSIKWQLFSMVDEMCVKMVDLKGQTALALSVRWRWCHPNTAVTFVELGVYLWMCLTTWGYGCVWCVSVCVRVLRRGWLCLKVVLTVYTKRSPKESASLVDPVQMCCVYQRLVLSTSACLLRVRIVPLGCHYVRWHEFFTPRN